MAAPGAFVAPSQFEEVKWKAGLPKGSELWLAQLPLSVRVPCGTNARVWSTLAYAWRSVLAPEKP